MFLKSSPHRKEFSVDNKLAQFSKAIRSSLPGRLRLRMPLLKGLDDQTADLLTTWLKSRTPGINVIFNPRVGSALITWDPERDSLDIESLMNEATVYMQMTQASGFAAAKNNENVPINNAFIKKRFKNLMTLSEQVSSSLLDTLSPFIAPDLKQKARKRRVTQNRLMLGSLAASIGVLIGSQSRSHIIFGIGFLALLSIHLLQHRKVL